jgi:predicted SprT family Zn-dependent metalloprotease
MSGAVARAAIVRLVCPKCGEVQARARRPRGATYPCRKCAAPLTLEANGPTVVRIRCRK